MNPPRHGTRELDVLEKRHETLSRTIRRTLLTIAGFSLFTLLTISGSDKNLLAVDSTVHIPATGTSVSYASFLVTAPLLLSVLALYLHIFVGHWKVVQRSIESIERKARITAVREPFLFNLDGPVPRWLSTAMMYVLVPSVLAAVTYKALPRPEAPWLLLWTSLVSGAHCLLHIKRSGSAWNAGLRWSITILFGLFALNSVLQISRADGFLPARRVTLRNADLHDMNLGAINLKGADLSRAVLSGADLSGGALSTANLRGANLSGSTLADTDLAGALMAGADLRGAFLRGASLDGAEFTSVNLGGADLVGATGLSTRQLETACGDAATKLPDPHGSARLRTCVPEQEAARRLTFLPPTIDELKSEAGAGFVALSLTGLAGYSVRPCRCLEQPGAASCPDYVIENPWQIGQQGEARLDGEVATFEIASVRRGRRGVCRPGERRGLPGRYFGRLELPPSWHGRSQDVELRVCSRDGRCAVGNATSTEPEQP